MNDNWNEIAAILKEEMNDNISPDELRIEAEGCFRMLGWRKTNGSLKYLDNDKGTLGLYKNDVVLVIDVNISMSPNEREKNLGKVMLASECKQGILVSDKLRLYYLDSYTKVPSCIISIPLEENNEQGSLFCDLFTYNNFNIEDVTSYFNEMFSKIPARGNLRKKIIDISSNENKLLDIFGKYLISEGFSENDVKEELSDFHLSATFMGKSFEQKSGKQEKETKDTRDTTKFSMDGINFYPKKIFVLNVIKRYVSEHPGITYEELEEQFPSRIASKTRGVVRPLNLVEEWIQTNPDIKTRYCLKPQDIITLSDGMKITVHNQWGDKNFPKFLEIAKSLYSVTSNRPYKEKENECNFASEEAPGIHISGSSLESFKRR